MRRVEDPKARRRDERRRSEMSQEALQSWDGLMMNWKVLRKAEGNWERPRRTGKRSEKLRWVEKSWDELRRAEMSRGNTMSWEELRWAEKCGHVLGRAKTSSSSEGLRWTSKSSRELRCAERSCDKMRRLCTPDSKPYTPQFPLRTLHSTLDSPFYSPLHYSLHPQLHTPQYNGTGTGEDLPGCWYNLFQKSVLCDVHSGSWVGSIFSGCKRKEFKLSESTSDPPDSKVKQGMPWRQQPRWVSRSGKQRVPVGTCLFLTHTHALAYIYIYICIYIYIYIHIYTTPMWTICISITIR